MVNYWKGTMKRKHSQNNMKIPKKLKIGGHIYKILYPYKFDDRSDLFGQADHALKRIKICGIDPNGYRRPDSSILETFMHEIIHCANDITHSNLNEQQVSAMSEALFQVLYDNKLFNNRLTRN